MEAELEVMNLSVLLEQYQNSPRLFQLANRLSYADIQRIYLKNLQILLLCYYPYLPFRKA